MGADPTCAFMLEAQRKLLLFRRSLWEYSEEVKADDGKPIPGLLSPPMAIIPPMRTIRRSLMAGPGVKRGVRVPDICLIDEGPTIAKLMGSSLWGVDGRIRYEFIDYQKV